MAAKTKNPVQAAAAPAPAAATLPPYRLTEQVGHLLRRAHQRESAIFQDNMGDAATPTQFAALAMLTERGPLSQNHLGRLIAMDPATIQGVVQRLGERKLVDRVPDPVDKRRFLVRLTRRGVEAYEAMEDRARAVTRETLSPLEPDEQAQFIALLKRLG